VPAWFDHSEGQADSSLIKQWLEEARQQSLQSVYEDEEISPEQVYARLDQQRLLDIKELMFNTFRDKMGQNQLSIPDLISVLWSLEGEEGRLLGETMLK